MTTKELLELTEKLAVAQSFSDLSSCVWIMKAGVRAMAMKNPGFLTREEHEEIQDLLSTVCRRLLMRKLDSGAEVKRTRLEG